MFRTFLVTLTGTLLVLLGTLTASAAPAVTITVNTTADTVATDGKCSLREAIQAANTNTAVRECPAGSGVDTIQFALGTGTPTINVTGSGLPTITAGVTINGNTGGAARIELNGAGTATNTNGLTISASSVTIKALVINRFGGNGIELRGAGKHHISGSLIGTNKLGTLVSANGGAGILVNSSAFNTIGGTTTADRNIISGNGTDGILLNAALNSAQAPNSNTILGNFIGTNVTGTAALSNGVHGVLLESGGGNVIGGTTGITVGGPCTGACNVISGNHDSGIEIQSNNNSVQGNMIGTDVHGTAALANGDIGVHIVAANNNTIGGTSASARNIISTNLNGNINITSNPHNNVVRGNFIGTAVNGIDILETGDDGVVISGGLGNVIGGTTGTTPGGACTGACNVIAGNDGNGILLVESEDTLVQGNFIGTAVNGTAARGNGLDGIDLVNAGNNTIGGTTANARNLISGNLKKGVVIETANLGVDSSENVIEGNFIGTTTTGTAALANGEGGISISAGTDNVIGGTTGITVGGACTGACNVVSGNGATGIAITTDNNRVQGNFIGTTVTGTTALGNADEGILILNEGGNTIGGITATSRNIISANQLTGISIVNSPHNTIQGNFIGDNVSGFGVLGNKDAGILVDGGTGNTIGGSTDTTPGGACTGACNNIAGSVKSGLLILDSTQTEVKGNYIGLNADGTTTAGGNQEDGVLLQGTAADNTIGGTTPGERNVISANSINGVHVDASGSNNIVQGNYIGTNTTGTGSQKNSQSGVSICASNTTIGGSAAGAGNLISGNLEDGVSFSCDGRSGNQVLGNFIGTDVTGTAALSNGRNGVKVSDTGGVIIGGVFGAPAPAGGNVIAFNTEAGVRVDNADESSIRFNSIFSNTSPEINLTNANNVVATPILSSATSGSTHIVGAFAGASSTTYALDFYVTPDCGHPQGKTYLGSKDVTTDTNGNVNFTADLTPTAPGGWFVTATATDPDNNTSQFSACAQVSGPTPTPGCTGKPANPALLKPANNAVVLKTRPTLKWSAANCADTYTVIVKDKATGKRVDKSTALTVLKYKTITLTIGKSYKWFVKACRAGQCSSSVKRIFTVQ